MAHILAIIRINLHLLPQLDFGKLFGGDVGTEVNLLHIRHFEKRGTGSSQLSGFGIFGKDGSRQRRGDVAFAQLVFYLRHLDADGGGLANTYARMFLLYNGRAVFRIRNLEEGLSVIIGVSEKEVEADVSGDGC